MHGNRYRYSPYFDRSCKRKGKQYERNATRKGRALLENIESLMMRDCVYCGEPAAEGNPNGVDRVDNDGDYVRGNCVPACTLCNFMKGKLDVATFLAQVSKISANMHNARCKLSEVVCERPDNVYE